MKSRLRWLLLLALCLLGIMPLGSSPAHADGGTNTAPITDPARVSEHYRQVLERPEFQENREADVHARLGELISQWFLRLGAKFGQFKYADKMPAFASLLMTLFAILTMAGLLYIIVRLTRRRGEWDRVATTGDSGRKMFRPPEFYDEEIHRAVAAGDWHAAWLAAWRQFLSRLENRHLVEADRTRTNREYLAQLCTQPLPSAALALLTGMVDAYDRFIYGRQRIGETDWNLFHRQIDEAALLLHLDDAGWRTGAKPGGA